MKFIRIPCFRIYELHLTEQKAYTIHWGLLSVLLEDIQYGKKHFSDFKAWEYAYVFIRDNGIIRMFVCVEKFNPKEENSIYRRLKFEDQRRD